MLQDSDICNTMKWYLKAHDLLGGLKAGVLMWKYQRKTDIFQYYLIKYIIHNEGKCKKSVSLTCAYYQKNNKKEKKNDSQSIHINLHITSELQKLYSWFKRVHLKGATLIACVRRNDVEASAVKK